MLLTTLTPPCFSSPPRRSMGCSVLRRCPQKKGSNPSLFGVVSPAAHSTEVSRVSCFTNGRLPSGLGAVLSASLASKIQAKGKTIVVKGQNHFYYDTESYDTCDRPAARCNEGSIETAYTVAVGRLHLRCGDRAARVYRT